MHDLINIVIWKLNNEADKTLSKSLCAHFDRVSDLTCHKVLLIMKVDYNRPPILIRI